MFNTGNVNGMLSKDLEEMFIKTFCSNMKTNQSLKLINDL
jgi:hypothetical protein